MVVILMSAVAAQQPEGQDGGQDNQWARDYLSRSVVISTAASKLSGRLVSVDEKSITVDVPNPEPWATPRFRRTTVSLADVRTVAVREKDSIVDGVVIGAIASGICMKWIGCGQGLDGQHNGRDWAVGIGIGALFGGGFDAAYQRKRVIYAPGLSAAEVRRQPALLFAFRF
jgi:hypothetical protein